MLLKVRGPNSASRSYWPFSHHTIPPQSPTLFSQLWPQLHPGCSSDSQVHSNPRAFAHFLFPLPGRLLPQVSVQTFFFRSQLRQQNEMNLPSTHAPWWVSTPFPTTWHFIYSSVSVSPIPNKNREHLFVQCYHLRAHKRMVVNTYLLKRWGRGAGEEADEKRYFQNSQLLPSHS